MAEYLIQEETLTRMADVVRSKIGWNDMIAELISASGNLYIDSIPESVTIIGERAFLACNNVSISRIPESVAKIGESAFNGCSRIATITFDGTPSVIGNSAFGNMRNLTTINVPWAEGEVAGAPWGATNATINYGYALGGGKE